ncbi:hypothetical protein [Endozoicomonas arenosclerae]|uniref:hypothetical protein n=1 Tax=Endozoicomonas arenosclerae TaxID=1633495 RepID=UPI000ABCF550|nr:hypothetical protein [Endozoicomonas arenosclerae]
MAIFRQSIHNCDRLSTPVYSDIPEAMHPDLLRKSIHKGTFTRVNGISIVPGVIIPYAYRDTFDYNELNFRDPARFIIT